MDNTSEALAALCEPPEDGIHTVSMETYLGWDALNASMIHELVTRSPAHAKWRRDHPDPPRSYTEQGTAMHMAILEPERFEKLYRACEGPWNKNPYKKEKEAVEAAGLVPIKPDNHEACLLARANVLEIWPHIFLADDALVEKSIVWTEMVDGVPVRCKIRPDLLSPDTRLNIDLKTHAGDITEARFFWTARDFGYDRKFAWYLRGCAKLELPYDAGLVIAIEQEGPCGVIPYAIWPDRLVLAGNQCDAAIALYARCRAENRWSGYATSVRMLFEEKA
jgi:hypothetical protein